MTLGREAPFEQRVDGRRRPTEIVSLGAATTLEPPDQGEAWEQQRAEVRRAGYHEASALYHVSELAGRVAAPMAECTVVSAPEPGERRHGDDERATAGERPPGGGERGRLVVQVLEHVEEEDDVGPSLGHHEIGRHRTAADVEAVGAGGGDQALVRLHA